MVPGTFQLEGDLAESWRSPATPTHIFKLRRGVRRHPKPPVNGRELTADDVKFTFDRFLGPHRQSQPRPSLEEIDQVDVPHPAIRSASLSRRRSRGSSTRSSRHHRAVIVAPRGGGAARRSQAARGVYRDRALDARTLRAQRAHDVGAASRLLRSQLPPTLTASRPRCRATRLGPAGSAGSPDSSTSLRGSAWWSGGWTSTWAPSGENESARPPSSSGWSTPHGAMKLDQEPFKEARVRRALAWPPTGRRRSPPAPVALGQGVPNPAVPAALTEWAIPIDQLSPSGRRLYEHNPDSREAAAGPRRDTLRV